MPIAYATDYPLKALLTRSIVRTLRHPLFYGNLTMFVAVRAFIGFTMTADSARQIDAVRALYDVSRGAALWLLRRHGWHHSHVVRALEEEPSLREQLGLLSPRPSALDDEEEGTTEEPVTPQTQKPRADPDDDDYDDPAAEAAKRKEELR